MIEKYLAYIGWAVVGWLISYHFLTVRRYKKMLHELMMKDIFERYGKLQHREMMDIWESLDAKQYFTNQDAIYVERHILEAWNEKVAQAQEVKREKQTMMREVFHYLDLTSLPFDDMVRILNEYALVKEMSLFEAMRELNELYVDVQQAYADMMIDYSEITKVYHNMGYVNCGMLDGLFVKTVYQKLHDVLPFAREPHNYYDDMYPTLVIDCLIDCLHEQILGSTQENTRFDSDDELTQLEKMMIFLMDFFRVYYQTETLDMILTAETNTKIKDDTNMFQAWLQWIEDECGKVERTIHG